MTFGRLYFALAIVVLISTVAVAAPTNEFRSFKGTWLCPDCAVMKQAETSEECEAQGHRHLLKLDDGQLIAFLDSPRTTALVHGGGRAMTRIHVFGLYDERTRTLDVDAYQFDDIWSTWCQDHGRMDACRFHGESGRAQEDGAAR